MNINETLQTFLEGAWSFVPKIIAAVVTFVIAVILSGLVSRWVAKVSKERVKDDGELSRLLSRIARWSVLIGGTLVALDQVDFDITGFLAGLGVAGFTIGFALQDIARNFVAGILLLIRQPFQIGDRVELMGYTGTVLDVTTRDTVVETLDGEAVILPNADVFTNPIVNYSQLPYIRRTVMVGLGYGQDVNRVRAVFLDAMRSVEGVLDDPAPSVLAEGLGDSALNLAARFWVDMKTHSFWNVHSGVVQAINDAAEREGIDLPYPVQTVRLEGVGALAAND